MAPHSSTLAWKIPCMAEPGGLQSMGSLRVGHDRATSLSLSCTGEGNGNPLQCSCLENPRHGGAWWAAVCGVVQSRTRLQRLSSSSSSGKGEEHPLFCWVGLRPEGAELRQEAAGIYFYLINLFIWVRVRVRAPPHPKTPHPQIRVRVSVRLRVRVSVKVRVRIRVPPHPKTPHPQIRV